MKKRVLLIVPSLEIGGQERIAVNTAEGLRKFYDVEMAVFQERNVDCYAAPCSVINLNIPAKRPAIRKVLNQLKRSLKLFLLRNRKKYDYVLSFGSTANMSNALSGIFGKGKTICAIHGFAEVRKSVVLSTIIKLSDKVICIAKAMQSGLLNIYPQCQNSIVIENGYVLHNVTETDIGRNHRSDFPVFVSMGRMEHVKGFDILISAFRRVHAVIPESQLWLIGDGSLRGDLEKECADNGLEHAVKFFGYLKDPHTVLQDASIYVLSSRNEGLPNALIEALNAQLPVISVDCISGPREILTGKYEKKTSFGIEHADNGILVENFPDEDKRVKYLAKAMIDLAGNPELQMSLRNRALQRAMDYSLESYIGKLQDLLASLQ